MVANYNTDIYCKQNLSDYGDGIEMFSFSWQSEPMHKRKALNAMMGMEKQERSRVHGLDIHDPAMSALLQHWERHSKKKILNLMIAKHLIEAKLMSIFMEWVLKMRNDKWTAISSLIGSLRSSPKTHLEHQEAIRI
ncbi:hypothetical protein N7504_004354 [Penicillium tannophilum]|nr:hypothetical protein N7504_004354 [Penicillium tannophilum]